MQEKHNGEIPKRRTQEGMKSEVSILIPTYNHVCVEMVQELSTQALQVEGLAFEVLVGDDGSTNRESILKNRRINTFAHCHYIENTINLGRAAIRNQLAKMARYRWLLFVDSDMTICSTQFLKQYLDADPSLSVICGGYKVIGDNAHYKSNLRYRYESKSGKKRELDQRQKSPYQHFSTANFMISRNVMLAHPFDNRLKEYGYEDVLLGKTLQENQVAMAHIHNPVGFEDFEENEDFLKKTEEGIRTLKSFQQDLQGYSRLLGIVHFMERIHLDTIYTILFRSMRAYWRKNLCSASPSLMLFQLYKIGYYFSS
ncbi:MAG TPA: glycosyltransferase family 2 protein [Prevotella sp.]|nr:glycosyltransferase family 2 protein [Prevotella sp.]